MGDLSLRLLHIRSTDCGVLESTQTVHCIKRIMNTYKDMLVLKLPARRVS
jgi:hypothetical protein